MSLILKVSDYTVSDSSIPTLNNDGVIKTGSKFLYDVLDPTSNPKYGLATANHTTGATFTNLVTSVADATVTNGPSINHRVTGQEFFTGATGPSGGIDLGTGFSLHNKSFIVTCWYKQDSTNFLAAVQALIAKGPGTTACQYAIATDPTGRIIQMAVSNATNFVVSSVGTITQNVIEQVALAYVGGYLYTYKNGNRVGKVALTNGGDLSTPADSDTIGYGYGSPPTKMFMYRWYKEDLTASGFTSDEVAYQDYINNVGRFS